MDTSKQYFLFGLPLTEQTIRCLTQAGEGAVNATYLMTCQATSQTAIAVGRFSQAAVEAYQWFPEFCICGKIARRDWERFEADLPRCPDCLLTKCLHGNCKASREHPSKEKYCSAHIRCAFEEEVNEIRVFCQYARDGKNPFCQNHKNLRENKINEIMNSFVEFDTSETN